MSAGVGLTGDPRDGRLRPQQELAAGVEATLDIDSLRQAARERFLTLDWDPRYERAALEELAEQVVVVLDQAELDRAYAEGRRQILGYSESGTSFLLKQPRPGKRHFEFSGDCHVTVDLARSDDDVYCRLSDRARATIISGKVYLEQDATALLSRSGSAHLFDRARAVVDSMSACAYAHGTATIELRRGSQVRADEQAVVEVSLETSRGAIVLDGEAKIVAGGDEVVRASELREADNVIGNERWLRGADLRCFTLRQAR